MINHENTGDRNDLFQRDRMIEKINTPFTKIFLFITQEEKNLKNSKDFSQKCFRSCGIFFTHTR